VSQLYFLDTNVIVRLLLEDNKEQLKVVKKYFEEARKGKLQIRLPLFIIIETAHILHSFYSIPKNEICDQLIKVILITYLGVDQREIVIKALRLYKVSNIDLVDCMLFAIAEGQNAEVLSFDKDFKKLAKT